MPDALAHAPLHAEERSCRASGEPDGVPTRPGIGAHRTVADQGAPVHLPNGGLAIGFSKRTLESLSPAAVVVATTEVEGVDIAAGREVIDTNAERVAPGEDPPTY
jgi:hypothetical protein